MTQKDKGKRKVMIWISLFVSLPIFQTEFALSFLNFYLGFVNLYQEWSYLFFVQWEKEEEDLVVLLDSGFVYIVSAPTKIYQSLCLGF